MFNGRRPSPSDIPQVQNTLYHVPVLLAPILERARGATRVVDATLGHGGHAAGFLAQGAQVLGIDRDPDAITTTRIRLGTEGITYLQAPYASDRALRAIAAFHPDFILLDLGVSSRQLDAADRGFTFRPGAPLDMRMGPDAPTAAEWLASVDEDELRSVLHDYADEPRATRMASEIIRRRDTAPFETSDDLVNAIRAVLGARSGPGDFARIFQGPAHCRERRTRRTGAGAARVSRGAAGRRNAGGDQLSFGRGSAGEGRVSRVAAGMHLPAGIAAMHMRQDPARIG